MGSKDTLDIPSWACGNNSPGKDQMSDVFAAAYDAPNGHTILYFGADRLDNNGDANLGFWFIQDQTFSQQLPGGGFTGVHKDGDVFIASQFTNGGSQPTIVVYVWKSGSLQSVATDAPCPTPLTDGRFGLRDRQHGDDHRPLGHGGDSPERLLRRRDRPQRSYVLRQQRSAVLHELPGRYAHLAVGRLLDQELRCRAR